MRYLFLILTISLFACSSVRQIGSFKIMKFNSAFGNFSMEVPGGWTKTEILGVPSFFGHIDLGSRDTITFNYGYWASELQNGRLYGNAAENERNKINERQITIDKCIANVAIPKTAGQGITRVYFDSLYSIGPTIVRMDMFGENLKQKNQILFLQAIKSLKFEKR